MIDEKVLIERITSEYSTIPYRLINPRIEDVKEQNAYMKCIKIVNQLAEESNNGWIPCGERLPKLYEYVFGICADGDTEKVALYKDEIFGKVWKVWNGGSFKLEAIIAWQPLPPRYEPKGDLQNDSSTKD